MVKASMARQRAIEEAIQICHDFQDSVNAILEWLPDAEQALEALEPISENSDKISQQIQELLVSKVCQVKVSCYRVILSRI